MVETLWETKVGSESSLCVRVGMLSWERENSDKGGGVASERPARSVSSDFPIRVKAKSKITGRSEGIISSVSSGVAGWSHPNVRSKNVEIKLEER